MGIKAKEKYHLKSGAVCVGTTTVIGELGWNKNSLVSWANKLGLQGFEARKFVDDKASIGSLAHAMVLASFKKTPLDTKDYTANQISLAENCLSSYYAWAKNKTIEPLIVEEPMVSEIYRYGGTPDFFGGIDGLKTLVDYKTGKGIYSEYTIQVAAYINLLIERGEKVDKVRILSIPRADDESFSEKLLTETELSVGFEIFKHLLKINELKGAIKKEY